MELQKLVSTARKAIDKYQMIQDGDKIAIGLSGGKDSVCLLYILAKLRIFYPKKFDLIAITIDMGFDLDKTQVDNMKTVCDQLNVEYIIEKTQIAEIIFDVRKESNPCSLCAKMRRGALNDLAIKHGCNKLALGHHADDLTETFFLSMIYEGRLSTFSPVTYMSKSKMTAIRPMLFIKEKDIICFSKDKPTIFNPCPANKNTQREYIKSMLKTLQKDIPIAKDRIHSALIHPERNKLIEVTADKNND